MSTTPRILLISPPLTQLNTPYPATAYLTGVLRRRGYEVAQRDLGLELVLRALSRDGLAFLFDAAELAVEAGAAPSERAAWMLARRRRYEQIVDAAVRLLQRRDGTLAYRVVHGDLLPLFARDDADEVAWAFGEAGVTDHARLLASRFVGEVAALIGELVTPHFGLSRYAERLAAAQPSYGPLREALEAEPNPVDALLEALVDDALDSARPDVVGLSVPFPGNVYGALRIAGRIRERAPDVQIVLGGGYVNTELRELAEPAVFDRVDWITYDDGEQPLLCLLEHLQGRRDETALLRTRARRGGRVVWLDGATDGDIPHAELGAPDYRGLPLERYLSVLELPNPMHRLWSDGQWLKLTIAHGCYWKKCSFCDVGLDYIARYDGAPAAELVDRIEQVVADTGHSGIHFVDEAAPPAALRELALELLRRGTVITWWTNVRFERAFSADLCRLLAASGCVALSGGLEVAGDRLLARMNKGVTVAQVARVCRNLTDAGIMVHAYLMYGFPTQTVAETVDALEVVRQLFEAGVVQSGYWHRFAMTVHSPVGMDPQAFGARALPVEQPAGSAVFARNDVEHVDPDGADHDALGPGLARALYNFMHGVALDEPAHTWFDDAPPTSLAPDAISQALDDDADDRAPRAHTRVVWIGPAVRVVDGSFPGWARLEGLDGADEIELPAAQASWLVGALAAASPGGEGATWGEWRAAFPDGSAAFDAMTWTPAFAALRAAGLLLL